MTIELDRRTLLKGVGGAAALGSVGSGLLGLVGCAPDNDHDLEAALAGCVVASAAARVVGDAALASFGPSPPGAAQWVEQIVGGARGEWEARAAAGPAELFAAVRVQHLADFEAGRLFRVRGWLLSQTEARLCALVASRRGTES